MNDENAFSYTYSAKENQEVLDIRKKYLQQEESKMDELRRLDRLVQNSGVIEALSAGIVGTLIFGLGLCLSMKVIGNIVWLGVVLGMIGVACMLSAYPIYRKIFAKVKEKYTPRILELANDLSKNK